MTTPTTPTYTPVFAPPAPTFPTEPAEAGSATEAEPAGVPGPDTDGAHGAAEQAEPQDTAPATRAADNPPGPGSGARAMVPVQPDTDEYERIARSRGWTFFDLDDLGDSLDEDVYKLLEPRTVRKYLSVPVKVTSSRVTVAVSNPDDLPKAGELRPLFGARTMSLVYADPGAIRRHIDNHYSATAEASRIGEENARSRSAAAVAAAAVAAGGNAGRVEGGEGANVTMMRLIIEQAIAESASDIHLEPTEHHLEVRYRVDGKLRVARELPRSTGQGLMTYIKVQSEMRTDNFLVPDSGVMYYAAEGAKTVDIRVETAPTAFGTSAVMRLQAEIWRELSSLGFSEENESRFRAAIAQPYGVILLTGPTGSGKTTTLYSALRDKIDPQLKIITLENPVEYKIEQGVSQMSVSESQGMTFSLGLRSILRQDPDVVLVGEIRDGETAETAVDAAMTGHLVFSTLHTNDAPGVVPRLVRMGIEPFLVASSLLCVVGQRLVRRLCGHCKVAVEPDTDLMASLGFTVPDELPEHVYDANDAGCEHCVLGYKGRVPIHEVMLINDTLAEAIAANASFSQISAAARDAGMTTLREDGFAKVLAGITSLHEVNTSTRQELA